MRDIDPQNDLTFLRIRSKKHEIMVAPGLFFVLFLVSLISRHRGFHFFLKLFHLVFSRIFPANFYFKVWNISK